MQNSLMNKKIQLIRVIFFFTIDQQAEYGKITFTSLYSQFYVSLFKLKKILETFKKPDVRFNEKKNFQPF